MIVRGKYILRRDPLAQLVQRNFLHQVNVLRRFRGNTSVVSLWSTTSLFKSIIHVNGSVAHEISPSLRTPERLFRSAGDLYAPGGSGEPGNTCATARISAQLDAFSRQYDVPPGVERHRREWRRARTSEPKITQVGQQLRGVHEFSARCGKT